MNRRVREELCCIGFMDMIKKSFTFFYITPEDDEEVKLLKFASTR